MMRRLDIERPNAVRCGAFCISASVASSQAAPAKQCILQYESSSGNTRTNAVKLPSQRYNFFRAAVSRIIARDRTTLSLPTAPNITATRALLYMIGSVHYTEPRAKVDSDRMTYYQLEDRLRAEGNVNVKPRRGRRSKGRLWITTGPLRHVPSPEQSRAGGRTCRSCRRARRTPIPNRRKLTPTRSSPRGQSRLRIG